MTAGHEPLYTVPELAAAFAVTPRAIRFYETKGLLSPRRVGNRRVYDRRDRARLQLILRGKRLGFSLAEIRDYLELYDADAGQTRQIRQLEKLVSTRITDLERQRAALDTTLNELLEIRDQVRDEMRKRGIQAGREGIRIARSARPANGERATKALGPQGDKS